MEEQHSQRGRQDETCDTGSVANVWYDVGLFPTVVNLNENSNSTRAGIVQPQTPVPKGVCLILI